MEDYPNLTKAMAETISELREERGLTTAELARLSGIDRVYLTLVQQGKYRLTLNATFWLAKGLEMRATELVDLIEQKVRKNFG